MSDECKGATAVILSIALAVALILGGIALITSQGQAQTCARAGGIWIAHSEPLNSGSIQDRKCDR